MPRRASHARGAGAYGSRNERFHYNMVEVSERTGTRRDLVAELSAEIYDAILPREDEFRYTGSMGHLLGYARVSTSDQDAALQVDALQAAGCYRVFVDTISGALEHRPELDKLLAQLRPGDTLVVWRLDRLGRSIRHLIDQLQVLADRGGGFRSLQETIDTTGFPLVAGDDRHDLPGWPTGLSRLRRPRGVRARPHP